MSLPRSIQNDVQAECLAPSLGHTTTSSTSAPRALMFYVTAPWHEILQSMMPVGYQDETGFHYGENTELGEVKQSF